MDFKIHKETCSFRPEMYLLSNLFVFDLQPSLIPGTATNPASQVMEECLVLHNYQNYQSCLAFLIDCQVFKLKNNGW